MHASHKMVVATGTMALLVAVVGFGVWYQFFREDAPPRVSLAAALESIETTAGTTDTSLTDAATAPELDGIWSVVSGSDSFAGYRIGEELASIGTTEAVGRTSAVEGTLNIEGGTLISSSLTVDMTTLESDESRRDQALERQSLETSAYPTATFEMTDPIVLADSLAEGDEATIMTTGKLTLHGVTQVVQIPLAVQLTDGVLVVVGSLDISLADYDIASPQSPSVVSVNDSGVLELQLFFSTAG